MHKIRTEANFGASFLEILFILTIKDDIILFISHKTFPQSVYPI